MRTYLSTVCASAFVLAFMAGTAPRAHAGPVSYQILDGATVIGSGTGASGSIAIVGSDANFSVNGDAAGNPFLNSPNFSTDSFTIHNTGGGATTLTIKITDVNLPSFSGTFANTFALNSLLGDAFQSGTISNYFDASNTPFGTATLVGTSGLYSGLSAFSTGPTTGSTSIAGPFSETTIYTLNFGTSTGVNGNVSASSQLVGTAQISEPASLALLGIGLAGIGFVRRRRA